MCHCVNSECVCAGDICVVVLRLSHCQPPTPLPATPWSAACMPVVVLGYEWSTCDGDWMSASANTEQVSLPWCYLCIEWATCLLCNIVIIMGKQLCVWSTFGFDMYFMALRVQVKVWLKECLRTYYKSMEDCGYEAVRRVASKVVLTVISLSVFFGRSKWRCISDLFFGFFFFLFFCPLPHLCLSFCASFLFPLLYCMNITWSARASMVHKCMNEE